MTTTPTFPNTTSALRHLPSDIPSSVTADDAFAPGSISVSSDFPSPSQRAHQYARDVTTPRCANLALGCANSCRYHKSGYCSYRDVYLAFFAGYCEAMHFNAK